MAVGFARGWLLTEKAWQLVRDDLRLLVFPSISAVLGLAAGFVGFLLVVGRPWWTYLAGFTVLTFPLTVVSTYLGVAFVAIASRSLDGEPFSIRDGLRCSRSRLPAIVGWSLLATFVGLVLAALRYVRGGWLATRLAGLVLGLAWAAGTCLVLPVIALENPGPFASVRRSATLVRKRWGETVAGLVSLGGGFVLVALPAGFLIAAGVETGFGPVGAALFTSGFVLMAGAVAYGSTTWGMLQLVLYRYATTGATAGAFRPEDLETAFRERPASRLRRRLSS